MKKYLGITALLFVFLLTISLVQAQPRQNKLAGPHFGHLCQELELSKEQKQKLEKINLEFRQKMRQYRADLGDVRDLLRVELEQEKSDRAKVESLVEKESKLQKEMKLLRLQHQQQIKNILSEEQYRKFKNLQHEKQQQRKNAQNFHHGECSQYHHNSPKRSCW